MGVLVTKLGVYTLGRFKPLHSSKANILSLAIRRCHCKSYTRITCNRPHQKQVPMFGKEIMVRVEEAEKSKKVISDPGAGGGKEIKEKRCLDRCGTACV